MAPNDAKDFDPCAPDAYPQAREDVAIWMGWKIVRYAKNHPLFAVVDPAGKYHTTEDSGWMYRSSIPRALPDFLHDPAAAWGLLEFMRARGFTIAFWCNKSAPDVRKCQVSRGFRFKAMLIGATNQESLFRAAWAAMRAEKEASANG